MSIYCNQCGDEYENISTHWNLNPSCSYPELTDKQKEVTTGILMGDGYLDNHAGNPYIELRMITPKYLEYIDNIFKMFGKGVRFYMTAEESAKKSRESGIDINADAEHYNDLYGWRSMTHPEFEEFLSWYKNGNKIWPHDITLTPTVLKHWYCGDGHRDSRTSRNNIQITVSNEINNTEKVNNLFKNVGLPEPRHNIQDSKYGKMCTIGFTKPESKELWEYMGPPLPGFEYKWPNKQEKAQGACNRFK